MGARPSIAMRASTPRSGARPLTPFDVCFMRGCHGARNRARALAAGRRAPRVQVFEDALAMSLSHATPPAVAHLRRSRRPAPGGRRSVPHRDRWSRPVLSRDDQPGDRVWRRDGWPSSLCPRRRPAFVQFHPTALNSRTRRAFPLQSVARRGRSPGNEAGERFVERYEPAGDLASALVARANHQEVQRTGAPAI